MKRMEVNALWNPIVLFSYNYKSVHSTYNKENLSDTGFKVALLIVKCYEHFISGEKNIGYRGNFGGKIFISRE